MGKQQLVPFLVIAGIKQPDFICYKVFSESQFLPEVIVKIPIGMKNELSYLSNHLIYIFVSYMAQESLRNTIH